MHVHDTHVDTCNARVKARPIYCVYLHFRSVDEAEVTHVYKWSSVLNIIVSLELFKLTTLDQQCSLRHPYLKQGTSWWFRLPSKQKKGECINSVCVRVKFVVLILMNKCQSTVHHQIPLEYRGRYVLKSCCWFLFNVVWIITTKIIPVIRRTTTTRF